MPDVIRWGILGAGDTATRFAQGLKHVKGAELTCVWSRRFPAAEAFTSAHGGVPLTDLALLLDGSVDAVYIATHPDSHHAYAMAALTARKHVLCEKPSMLNGMQLDEVLLAASSHRLVFMEAMKTPFFPLYRRLREHLQQDPVGQIGFVRAGSLLANIPLEHPVYNLKLGGGSLLAIAPYEAFLAVEWLGPVDQLQAIGRFGETGIDTFASLQTRHPHGVAQLHCGLGLHGMGDALLAGPRGNIYLPAKWWNPAQATIRYVDGRTVELDVPFVSTGFQYEAEHFCDLVRTGRCESPIMTHAMSRQMMRLLDLARGSIGLVYPQER